MSAPSRFGNSRVGGNQRTYVGLKDGDNVFRILPAMGDLADDGRWSVYYAVHYGYKNSKGKVRPFQSSLVKGKNKMIEVPDPALDRLNTLLAQLEKAKAEGNVEMTQRLDKLVGQGPNSKAQFNLDKKHYMNALDTQGNVVILKLSHKAKLALDAEIKKQRAQGVDPLSDTNGRFLVFHRSGKNRDTIVQVSVLQREIDVPGAGKAKQDVAHTIDDALANRLIKWKDGKWAYGEAAKLDSLFPKPTAEQIGRIVKEGPTAVDDILDNGQATESVAETEPSEYEEEPAATQNAALPPVQTITQPPVQQVAPAVQVTAPAPTVTTPPPAPAVQVTAPTPTVSVSQTPKTTAQTTAEMSDDDFLKSLGV